jgi:hypothetical protein
MSGLPSLPRNNFRLKLIYTFCFKSRQAISRTCQQNLDVISTNLSINIVCSGLFLLALNLALLMALILALIKVGNPHHS